MSEWIKLLDEKPQKKGDFKTLSYSEYGSPWEVGHLRWHNDLGFQPRNLGQPETYPINCNVAYWLKTEEPEPPVNEAEKLIIKTEVFFHTDGLDDFVLANKIELFSRCANADEYIISGVKTSVIQEMREKFQSNGIHKNIMKRSDTRY